MLAIGFALFVGVCFVLLGLFARSVKDNANTEEAKALLGMYPFAFGAALLLPALIVGCSSVTSIPAGHVGVVSHFGKIQDRPLTEGMNFVNPLFDVHKFNVQIKKHDGHYAAASADGQDVNMVVAINHRLIADEAPVVYRDIGTEYATVIIDPQAQEVLKDIIAGYKATEVLHSRAEISTKIHENLKKILLTYGVHLNETSIINITFSPEYAQAIERKQLKEQEAQQKQYELQREELEAQIREAKAKGDAAAAVAEAEGRAQAMRTEAQGRADALRIEAEAQADYNRQIAESITPAFIQYEYLQNWNGQLPHFLTGGGEGILLQVPTRFENND